MIAQHYKDMLGAKSVIRQISEWSTARGAQIGYENVFDYSLGNPSVPCPPQFTAACENLLQSTDPVTLHGYTPTLTLPSARKAVAESLNQRFGMDYTADHIFMTTGAAGALAHAVRCVAVPGQNIVTFAPFFPEYKPYVEGAGLTLRVTPPRCADFQIDFDAFAQLVAESLNRRFGMDYTADHIFMTSGAAGALAHALRCVAVPGQNIVTFAPFFPEYKPYVEGAGLTLRVTPPRCADFQIDFAAFAPLVDENTAAVLINSPNNPSGTAYSAETLQQLADFLVEASARFGHHIFLISDEPYREIAFGGTAIPYPAKFYDDTLTCYSFSKSLSVPGERIGYLAANPRCEDAASIVPMCGQISRGTGHNCPSSLIQMAVERCLAVTSDLSVYETNMNLLYDELCALGFTVVKPDGTFYIFPKALEEDAKAFCRKAQKYDLALVPGDSFGCPGYFRMAYCIGTEKVRRSFAALERFVAAEYGVTKQ